MSSPIVESTTYTGAPCGTNSTFIFTAEAATTRPSEEEMKQHAQRLLATTNIVNGIVVPNLRVLLFEVLNAIEASIPNRDQNRAAKHIVRTRFDQAYLDIVSRAFPDSSYASSGSYVVEPSRNLSDAMTQTGLKPR